MITPRLIYLHCHLFGCGTEAGGAKEMIAARRSTKEMMPSFLVYLHAVSDKADKADRGAKEMMQPRLIYDPPALPSIWLRRSR